MGTQSENIDYSRFGDAPIKVGQPRPQIEPLFCTPLYMSAIPSQEVHDELTTCLDDLVEWEDLEDSSWSGCHEVSKGVSNVIHEYELEILKDELDKHIRTFMRLMQYPINKYDIKESWFAKFAENSFAHLHTHGYADISGVYYYQTSGEDGDIFFETPGPHQGSKCFNQQTHVGYPPLNRGLLMFPGWLHHGVQRNLTDNVRISLSFNVYIDT